MNNVEKFRKIATELGELYEVKDRAYGSSFSDTYKKLGIISAVTRISDKYNRLCNLATNPDIDNLGESLEDTLRDMASYCIMTVMELNKEEISPIGYDPMTELAMIELDNALVFGNSIRRGDKFECIQDVITDDGSVDYRKGGVYISEKDDCITNLDGVIYHYWNGEDDWRDYFKRIN